MNTPTFQTKCPSCGKQHTYSTENPSRPFCSERCKLIDLGRWANEEYNIPATPSSSQDLDAPSH
ncbi:DNA gyrase inhibitor YacG [Janthinobacterium sp. B9-8]|uniref:DNA gyrase inhibitor YacG n=1 Tax=Janthinobacterium sp. B9-8 TaxID=1236179 RepID=UPI00061D1F6B|nr:DNA gyrase inhibitor YacG [Janthinobacterium sp. B9-8]AMC35883.1 DNA gyrase inhibitor [Janthinobacterium sp. B9-8]